MAEPVNWRLAAYQEALNKIPPRFRDLACQYAQEVADQVSAQYANSPYRQNAVETTTGCALSGLSMMRWYLLHSEERMAAAEDAWRRGGSPGLCRHMRELHLAEKSLLVAGYGNQRQDGVEARLSSLHAIHAFTLIAVAHGFLAERVKAWAAEEGIPCVYFPLGNERDLRYRLPGHYYYLLDMVAPAAICVLSPDELAMKLAYCATMKKVAHIDAQARPQSAPQQSLAKPQERSPVAATDVDSEKGQSAEAKEPRRRFQFSVLLGAEDAGPG